MKTQQTTTPAESGASTGSVRLSDDELSALIEACNVASGSGANPRPPWNRAGRSAWEKLIKAERFRSGKITCDCGGEPHGNGCSLVINGMAEPQNNEISLAAET